MFVCERNIAGSRTPTRPCDGLVRAWARAHDVSVVFFEDLVALASIRACVQDMEGRKKGATQVYAWSRGELSRILERALVNPSASLHFVVLVFHLQYFFR